MGKQPTRGLGSWVEGGVPSPKQELGSLCGRAVGSGWVGGRVLPGLWSWGGGTYEGVRKTRWSPRAGVERSVSPRTPCARCAWLGFEHPLDERVKRGEARGSCWL